MKKLFLIFLSLAVLNLNVAAQIELEPKQSAPRAVKIPAVIEKKLPNGITVVVVERRGAPLVSVQMIVDSGVTSEDLATAGLARMTANLLSKGTPTRNATKIANDIEFLGASISAGAGLDSSSVSLDVTSDKLAQAMPIFADVIRRPTFPAEEVSLAKTQALDELTYNLKQPGFLSNYVATAYSFYGNPSSGTPESIAAFDREKIADFYEEAFRPVGATLIFVGDITPQRAFALAQSHFGTWKTPVITIMGDSNISITESAASVEERKQKDREQPLVKRMLVVDLPKSGQASVTFAKHLGHAARVTWLGSAKKAVPSRDYFPAIVMNSLLGGGYSSRLNQEIRIKRGLSYGAGSSFTWRAYDARFSTRTQTKNESAAEVAELVVNELKRLAETNATASELGPRQAVLIGDFGRSLETNSSMIGSVADLYDVWLAADELGRFTSNVQGVTSDEVKQFAAQHLNGGDIIIVGDYSVFKDDLAKRFPGLTVDVIKADAIDLSKFQR